MLAQDSHEQAGQQPVHTRRCLQCADWGNEVLFVQPCPRSQRLVASTNPSGGIRTLANRRLFSRGKRGARAGSLRVSWLALHSSPSLRDDSEPTVLCPCSQTTI